MPSETTIDVTSARCVPLKTTSHEKDHFTVILSACADGIKLKPHVVFKGKRTRLKKTWKKCQALLFVSVQMGG